MPLALEQIRRMRGGAQAQLMRCADEAYYVVKFRNNPQGPRILANELLGTRLAARLGVSGLRPVATFDRYPALHPARRAASRRET